jgi:hypothetical protein
MKLKVDMIRDMAKDKKEGGAVGKDLDLDSDA